MIRINKYSEDGTFKGYVEEDGETRLFPDAYVEKARRLANDIEKATVYVCRLCHVKGGANARP